MTTSNNNYNLNQVHRELDFQNSKFGNFQAPGSTMNSKPNNLHSLLNNNPLFTTNPLSTQNTNTLNSSNSNTNSKSLSFVANSKNPTILKSNTINNYENIKPTIEDSKFTYNKDEPLDHKINLENILIGKDKRTTIMLRNIPNKYTLQNLVDEVNSTFLGKYDYINLPIDYEVNNNKKLTILEKIKSWICFYQFY